MKRTIIIILAVVVLALIGFFAWKFFLNKPATTTPGVATSTGSLPQTGVQPGNTASNTTNNLPANTNFSLGAGNTTATSATKFGILSNEPTKAYFVDPQNNVLIVEPDGKIARITNNQVTFLSSATISDLITASFSRDGAKLLVNFGDPANPQTSVFDVSTKAWSPLPTGITSPVWSPIDNRIAYLTQNNAFATVLSTIDATKPSAKPVTLFTLNAQDLTISWPNKNLIVFNTRPSSYIFGSLWFFDLQKKTLSQALPDAYGLHAIWSNTTSSTGLIFSNQVSAQQGALGLLRPSVTTTEALSFVTIPEKCVFNYEVPKVPTSTIATGTIATTSPAASTTLPAPTNPPYLALYCATPQDNGQLGGTHLSDGYNQMTFFTADYFYRIHTDSGLIEGVFAPFQNIDATNLRLFGNILFFINRYDQKLYAISLAQ